jgi:Bardet-Biedl syndrome 4 protein
MKQNADDNNNYKDNGNMNKADYEIVLRELAQQYKFDELLEIANKLAAEFPNWHLAWHYVGVAYGLQGNHEHAISNFIKALEVKPHSVKALYGLSVSFHALKMYEEAVSCLLKHKELHGDEFKILFNLGVNYTALNMISDAISSFEGALRFKQDSEETLFCLADCYRIEERYQEAIQLFLQSLELNPNNILVIHNTAVCYKYLNNNKKAIEYYKRVLVHDGSFSRSLRNLSEIYCEIGEVEQAQKLILCAKESFPESTEIAELHQKIFGIHT